MRGLTLLRAANAAAARSPALTLTRAAVPSASALATRMAALQVGQQTRQASVDAAVKPRAARAKKTGTRKAKAPKKPKLKSWEALGPDGKKLPLPFDSKPTRRTPFIAYMGERLAALKSDAQFQKASASNPGKQVVDLTKLAAHIGQEWRGLSDAQKQPYLDEAARENVAYQQKLKQWQDSLTPEDIRRQNAYLRDQRRKGKKGHRLLQDQKKPKQPLSAFFRYLQSYRESASESDPKLVVKSAAEKWKSMGASERQTYEQQASQAFEQYKRDLESYRASQ